MPGEKARLVVAVAATKRFSMKVEAGTLGVVRSDLVEDITGTGKASTASVVLETR